MPIPGPGTAISINTIVAEFGGTAPHSLSEYYRGGGLVPNTPGNAAIPTSGQIAMGNFYGSANRTAVALTISGNTYSYDVYANRGPTYVAGASDITVTVNPGVTVGTTSVPAYAMLVPSAFSPTDTVTIVNNGVIQGMGGTGGNGGAAVTNTPNSSTPGTPGSPGGSALYVNRPTTVVNNGTVASGGGGGGGGGGASFWTPKQLPGFSSGGGGGGGGSGFNGGGGGSGGPASNSPVNRPGSPGGPGSSPAGGGGGSGGISPGPTPGGPGGAGGGRGAGGASGTPAPPSSTNLQPSGGGGGGTGNYIVGNPFVTWPVTGTRQGNVA